MEVSLLHPITAAPVDECIHRISCRRRRPRLARSARLFGSARSGHRLRRARRRLRRTLTLLAVIEIKNPADENATVWSAFNQLQTYQAQIPSLLATNASLSDFSEIRTVAGLARMVLGTQGLLRAAGSVGGAVRTRAKARAARLNGRKGGRPRGASTKSAV